MKALRRILQFFWDALTGRLGTVMMVGSYGLLAAVLLAYVSTQVYTESLLADIQQRRRGERELSERIGVLTADYARLVSRSRISAYCENELGMVQADPQTMARIWVDSGESVWRPLLAPEDAVEIPSVLGSGMEQITEAMR